MEPHEPNYRTIPLTKGRFAIVDAANFEQLSKYKWAALEIKGYDTFYAVRSSPMVNTVRGPMILMHREILGLKPGDKRRGDHRSPTQTLVNVRGNLRIATPSQNNMNTGARRKNKSGYKGVSYHRAMQMYRARIGVSGVQIVLGYRPTAQQAHEELYVPAALKFHGEFANTGESRYAKNQ